MPPQKKKGRLRRKKSQFFFCAFGATVLSTPSGGGYTTFPHARTCPFTQPWRRDGKVSPFTFTVNGLSRASQRGRDSYVPAVPPNGANLGSGRAKRLRYPIGCGGRNTKFAHKVPYSRICLSSLFQPHSSLCIASSSACRLE